MTNYKINVGDKIPRFEAKDAEGKICSSKDLMGTSYVLYFYPKDETSVCTAEACSFRDRQEALSDLNCRVIGVSPDGWQSHKNFTAKNNLNFTLLCDEDRKLCKAFDVLREGVNKGETRVERTTFLVDEDGIVWWIERPVQVEGHCERIMQALTAHSTS